MILDYPNKRTRQQILEGAKPLSLLSVCEREADNKLIYGENTGVLRTLLDKYRGKIDLVYIDPPYGTNEKFTMSKTRATSVSRGSGITAYADKRTGSEYLEFIRERLVFLHELLSDVGSIYVHIDYKIGHYVKILMDEIFGIENFRNDIARIKCNPKNFNRKAYGNIKDLILFYSKSTRMIWNAPRTPYSTTDVERLFKKTDSNGRRYTTTPLHAPGETSNGKTGGKWRDMLPPEGRHWRVAPEILDDWDRNGMIEWSSNGNPRKKIFLDEMEGKKVQDIWEYKDPAYPQYPTEKNIDLLKMIVSASTQPNSIVLDCFCGSGTTLAAAAELGRSWIGIDESEAAINTCTNRLLNFDLLHDEQKPVPEFRKNTNDSSRYNLPLF